MGNTNPWAATNGRATLLSLDTSFKLQASSFKRQAATFRALNQDLAVVIWYRAARELVSMIRCKPCEACIRGEAGSSSQNKSNGAIASVPMRDLLIPLVDRPSHKSDSVRPARGSFSFPKIKASSLKRQAPKVLRRNSEAAQGASGKRQA